jgi:hypothetical protein
LFNQYGVILVNPQKHPGVKQDLGQMFIDWVVSPDGQKAIAEYKIEGQHLFYPNANDPGARGRYTPPRRISSGARKMAKEVVAAPSGNRFDRMEFAGAFGDLGTLVPFVVAYSAF